PTPPLRARSTALRADSVRDRLPQIRAQRFAFDHGELVKGISALAVPILPQGRDAIASLAIHMTSARLEPERLTELVGLLKAEVSDIERTINPLERSGSSVRRAG